MPKTPTTIMIIGCFSMYFMENIPSLANYHFSLARLRYKVNVFCSAQNRCINFIQNIDGREPVFNDILKKTVGGNTYEWFF